MSQMEEMMRRFERRYGRGGPGDSGRDAGTITARAMELAAESASQSIEVTQEQLDELLERWDLQAYGQRVYCVRLPRQESEVDLGNGKKLVTSTQQAADLSNDLVVISPGPLAYVHDLSPELRARRDAGERIPYEEAERLSQRLLRPGDRVHMARWSGTTESRPHLLYSKSRAVMECMLMNADDLVARPSKE